MTLEGPFYFANRLLRGGVVVLLIGFCVWLWQYRELVDPTVDLYRAWRLGTHTPTPGFEVRLTAMKVYDGDNLQARDAAGGIFTVRLAGLDAPDFGSPDRATRDRARNSRDFLAALVQTNSIRVEVTLTNESRVLLGVVYLGRTNVNAESVAAGHAEFRRDYVAGVSYRCRLALLQAERRARSARTEENRVLLPQAFDLPLLARQPSGAR